MPASTSRTIRGVSAWARAITSARTGAGIASQTPGWYSAMISRVISAVARRIGSAISCAMRSGSSRATTSFAEMRSRVIVSTAMPAMRAARRGTMPCQPR